MKDFQEIHFGDLLHKKAKGGAVTMKDHRFLSLKPKRTQKHRSTEAQKLSVQ